MTFCNEFAATASDEVHTGFFMGQGIDSENPPAAGISFIYSGTDSAYAEKLLAMLDKPGKPVMKNSQTQDYVAVQRSGDWDDIRTFSGYMKTGFVGEFDDKLAANIADHFELHETRSTFIATQQSGGAIGRVANEATAFAHREAHHNLLSFVSWKAGEDGEPHKDYIRAHWDGVKGHTQGFYSNDLYDQEGDDVNLAYRGNFKRLQKIKKQYDPTNLFRLNANIRSA